MHGIDRAGRMKTMMRRRLSLVQALAGISLALAAGSAAAIQSRYNLAPPAISKRDPVTGELVKRQFGPWMRTAFAWLKRFKGVRGSVLDLFGKTEERRMERELVEHYLGLVDEMVQRLSPANHAAAVALAGVPDEIRGYGHVKEKNVALARTLYEQRLLAFRNPQAVAAAPRATVAA